MEQENGHGDGIGEEDLAVGLAGREVREEADRGLRRHMARRGDLGVLGVELRGRGRHGGLVGLGEEAVRGRRPGQGRLGAVVAVGIRTGRHMGQSRQRRLSLR